MTEHIKNRNKLKAISELKRFDDLLEMSTLTPKDKQMLRMHYLDGKDFRYIGDMLGYSESAIKKIHKRAITKLANLL